ncbi:hypothetical protein BDF20DRAFT_990898 [Mycotypha africana]|uniref:uncharacterized protein n=1 Tax=Mycotypha africana TaxID=64632 RepID=UPI002301C753|nr:uncharacterized protein BDF20DRAFT_990898 [Mycotypha africana]KAI8969061.1 hypothetical protein BDF20DRAFT_990898 [Mycotypha africana]
MTNLNAVPFHEKSYWEDRFKREKHFEWLLTWNNIKSEIIPFLNVSDEILHVGCGNSTLAFDIFESGYRNITNVDYAENVISYMKSVTQKREIEAKINYSSISWYKGDCLYHLQSYLPKKVYPVVIDKSLIDTIACGDDDNQSRVKRLAAEILSVTETDGHWFSVSFSSEREYHCQMNADTNNVYHWKTKRKIPIQVTQLNDKPGAPPIYYYLYINQKIKVT